MQKTLKRHEKLFRTKSPSISDGIDYKCPSEIDGDFDLNGFQTPFIVKKVHKKALGMECPVNLKLGDVVAGVGPDLNVAIIDCTNHKEVNPEWTITQYKQYLDTPFLERQHILNLLSLEISNTKLGKKVRPPKIVREIDWINRFWPSRNATGSLLYPQVQKYCLLSSKGSFTDFHVDFGGSSVWYHVVKGEKVFYAIPPNKNTLRTYENWTNTSHGSDEIFLANIVEECFRFKLKEKETLMLPAGWIHAVYTPEDSIVFGGNYLHTLSANMQFAVDDIESRSLVPKRFRFPFFREINWFAAAFYAQHLRDPSTFTISERELHNLCSIYNKLYMWIEEPATDESADAAPPVHEPKILLRELREMLTSMAPQFAVKESDECKSSASDKSRMIVLSGSDENYPEEDNIGEIEYLPTKKNPLPEINTFTRVKEGAPKYTPKRKRRKVSKDGKKKKDSSSSSLSPPSSSSSTRRATLHSSASTSSSSAVPSTSTSSTSTPSTSTSSSSSSSSSTSPTSHTIQYGDMTVDDLKSDNLISQKKKRGATKGKGKKRAASKKKSKSKKKNARKK